MATAHANQWSAPRDGGLRARFWRKLKQLGAALPSRVPFSEDLLAAYYCAFDRRTPRYVQGSLAAALAYFVLPIDGLPDIVPLLGFSDDAPVLAATIKLVSDHITDDHREAARAFLERLR